MDYNFTANGKGFQLLPLPTESLVKWDEPIAVFMFHPVVEEVNQSTDIHIKWESTKLGMIPSPASWTQIGRAWRMIIESQTSVFAKVRGIYPLNHNYPQDALDLFNRLVTIGTFGDQMIASVSRSDRISVLVSCFVSIPKNLNPETINASMRPSNW